MPSVSLPRGDGMEPVEDGAFPWNVSLGIPSVVNTTSLSMTFELRLCASWVECVDRAIFPRSRSPLSLPANASNPNPCI